MKKIAIIVLSIFVLNVASYSLTANADGSTSYYTQLIGFKGAGEFYVSSFLSDWSTGVFFENVISQWLGLEIEMDKTAIPVTNYTDPRTSVVYVGNGQRNYIDLSGGLKFYVYNVSLGLGLVYSGFSSGYIVDNATSVYVQMSDKEINFFSVYFGPELTAQISTDLFTKVGIRVLYGFVPTVPNYTFGARFYIAFAYGM